MRHDGGYLRPIALDAGIRSSCSSRRLWASSSRAVCCFHRFEIGASLFVVIAGHHAPPWFGAAYIAPNPRKLGNLTPGVTPPSCPRRDRGVVNVHRHIVLHLGPFEYWVHAVAKAIFLLAVFHIVQSAHDHFTHKGQFGDFLFGRQLVTAMS